MEWYDGYPTGVREWPLEAERVAVIGGGNVAMDVARELMRNADDLRAKTDIPDNVYEGIKNNKAKELHLFIRRGVAQAKFSVQELREMEKLPGVQLIINEDDFDLDDETIEKLTWMGISGIANVLCCIKMAKYYELTEDDVVCTVLTDSAVMYGSRIEELNEKHGAYSEEEARLDHNLHMLGLKTDSMMELTYEDRKRIHNLKYYTWVEQQARDVKDLNALWYDTKGTWDAVHAQAKELDELINEFNEATGLLKAL